MSPKKAFKIGKKQEPPPPPPLVPSQINENCNSCGACLPLCPTKSIYVGGRGYVIDSDTCSTCLICASVCPVDAVANPALKPKVHLLKA